MLKMTAHTPCVVFLSVQKKLQEFIHTTIYTCTCIILINTKELMSTHVQYKHVLINQMSKMTHRNFGMNYNINIIIKLMFCILKQITNVSQFTL